MVRTSFRSVLALVFIIVGLMWVVPRISGQVFVGSPAPQQFSAQGQPSTRNGEWSYNAADLKGSRYSPLDQINASNFNTLEVAWRFELGAPNALLRLGWRRDSLPVGLEVEIEGFRAKAGGPVANGRSIKLADGRELFSGGSAPQQ